MKGVPWEPPEHVAHAIEVAYADGMSCERLARRHDVSAWSIAKLLRGRGVRLRGAVWEAPRDLVREYLDGASIASLAGRHGVTRATVKARLRERGVRIRDVGDATRLARQQQRNLLY